MKDLLRIAAFGAGTLIILGILSAVFRGGDLASKGSVIYYDRRIAELDNEPKGEIDVLCIGDSLCAQGFNSPALYRDFGITSYNMGKEMEKPVESYYCIKKAVETLVNTSSCQRLGLGRSPGIRTCRGSEVQISVYQVSFFLEVHYGRKEHPQVFQGLSGQ